MLIDIDELKSRMYQAAFLEDSNLQKWDGGCWIRYKLFERVVNSVPPATDAAALEVAMIVLSEHCEHAKCEDCIFGDRATYDRSAICCILREVGPANWIKAYNSKEVTNA